MLAGVALVVSTVVVGSLITSDAGTPTAQRFAPSPTASDRVPGSAGSPVAPAGTRATGATVTTSTTARRTRASRDATRTASRTRNATRSRPVTSSSTSRPTTSSRTSPAPADSGSMSSVELEVLELTNAERASAGCKPLTADSKLARAAGGHAEDMVERQYFSHTSPDGKGPGDRLAAAGFSGRGWGENIAAGQPTPKAVVVGWMNSSGHRANILNCAFNRLGVGYASGSVRPGYSPGSWVQDFGTA